MYKQLHVFVIVCLHLMDTGIIKILLNKNMIEQCFIFTNVHQDTCTMYAETLHL